MGRYASEFVESPGATLDSHLKELSDYQTLRKLSVKAGKISGEQAKRLMEIVAGLENLKSIELKFDKCDQKTSDILFKGLHVYPRFDEITLTLELNGTNYDVNDVSVQAEDALRREKQPPGFEDSITELTEEMQALGVQTRQLLGGAWQTASSALQTASSYVPSFSEMNFPSLPTFASCSPMHWQNRAKIKKRE